MQKECALVCSKKPELENRRMKQRNGKNRHMDGRLRVNHSNHFY